MPRPRRRHGRRLALLFHLGLTPNLCTLSFALLLSLLPYLPPLYCSSPRELASVYAANLRSHFSVSQPKVLRSKAKGYLSELRRATCPEEPHLSFCSPFSPAEFFAAASNLSSSTLTGPDKVAYPMLKHLPRSGMNFLLHIFNLSWSLHSFPSIWKTTSIIPIHKMGSFSTLLLPFGLSLSPHVYQSCLNASFYPVYSSFWSLIPFSLPARPISALDGLHSNKFCFFLSPFWMGLANPGRALGRSCQLSISFVWHPALFHKLISAGLPPCFARWTQTFLSDRRASVVFQNHKSRTF